MTPSARFFNALERLPLGELLRAQGDVRGSRIHCCSRRMEGGDTQLQSVEPVVCRLQRVEDRRAPRQAFRHIRIEDLGRGRWRVVVTTNEEVSIGIR